MAETGFFLSGNPFGQQLVLAVTPSETSFRLLERQLSRLEDVELRWHSETIEALADIFMSRPALLVVFGDTNAQTLEFIQLVRNNRQFRDLVVFAVLPEPVRMGQKVGKRLNIERFTTPLESSQLYTRVRQVIETKQSQPFKL
ncbi:MAG TPA: hypothetical protein V6D23_10365 [Candidatus Obscuribacterales bacterium]